MDLSGAFSVGTFVRHQEDGDMSLIWGTHRHPPKGKGLEFYSEIPGTRVVTGATKVAESLDEWTSKRSGTVVPRDFYPGWAKARFGGRGGKPFFLRVEDDSLLPIFFDDHIRP